MAGGIVDRAKRQQEEKDNAQRKAREEVHKRRQSKTMGELRQSNAALSEEVQRLFELNALLVDGRDRVEDYTLRLPKSKGAKPRCVSVSVLSDTHVEEIVEPEKVNGLNEHNIDIAEEKLHRFWRNVISLYKKEAPHVQIERHIMAIIGDLYSGDIHDDLIESTAFGPIEAVLWLLPRIREGIRKVRAEIDAPELLVVWKYGNHSRNTHLPRVSTAAEHSYEWLLGRILEDEMAGDTGIRFQVEKSYHSYVDCGGFVIRFHHGDWTAYNGGVGGISIPLNKAINEWNKSRWAHLDVIGHWHHAMNLRNLIVNGGLIGFSPYSIRVKAAFEPPSQTFFLVDMDRREKTVYAPVHVLDLAA